MKLQLLSDLHLETESFDPQPAPGADVLLLAGDIDSTWAGYERFAGWPVPVLVVAGNHEFDGRDFDAASAGIAELCARLGFTLLEQTSTVLTTASGQRVRFLGTTRWSDFDTFGANQRAKATRAAEYFLRLMATTRHGQPFDAGAVREQALTCKAWLTTELQRRPALATSTSNTGLVWDQTVAITHFAPSLLSADPRYGKQPGTASFCNTDDELLQHADLWLHGHLHCRHDYLVPRAGRLATRVVANPRGLAHKGEIEGYVADLLVEI
jgi:hypothetical protein